MEKPKWALHVGGSKFLLLTFSFMAFVDTSTILFSAFVYEKVSVFHIITLLLFTSSADSLSSENVLLK